jgi:hypothetical protein
MRTYWTKPGFELIFALSLLVIMALPPLVLAQGTKNLEIKIENGDTTINGKNIKDLSADDRKQALKDIDNLGMLRPMQENGRHGRQHLVLKNGRLPDTGSRMRLELRDFKDGDPMAKEFHYNDSTGHMFKFRMKRPDGNDSVFTFNYRMNGDPDEFFNDHERNFNFHMRRPGEGFNRRRNMQNFEYSNTSNDGITTHVSFRVNDPSPEKTKELTGSEKASLDIKDLNIVPEFSSGKTLLMFSMASPSIAEVKLTDNEGKLIWSDKATNGHFSKSFGLGLNGIYFLHVKQAGKVALKRIVKEE